MGNKWKGTFEVSIAGKEYALRPSFDALCEFDEVCGVSPQEARAQLVDGNFGPKVIPSALWAGMRGEYLINGGDKVKSVRVLGEMIRKEGFKNYQLDALKFLTYALSADDIIEKIESADDIVEEEEEEKKT
tara:strand:+ start:184 stop:576 length:393 start_codon:yes stop_codon:yes gene_type:complete